MSLKRQRPTSDSVEPQARKNKRPKVNLDLAQLWEHLVDEDEDVRLNAVYELLTIHCDNNDANIAQIIAKRLFRGLCSSRKNARQGFYVALVGALSMKDKPFGTNEISLRDTVRILETQTTPESGTSGQDERDHYFGRLLGCKALLESKALWNSGNQFLNGWEQIMDILCRLMAQKPWLRPESSTVLCSAIPNILEICSMGSFDIGTVISLLFQGLKAHKMLRTIEGIGIWLAFRQKIPNAKLPKSTWTSDSPLHIEELQSLKKILLSKRKADKEENLLGTSTWSPKLHPTWASIIRQFHYKQPDQVLFEDFWQEVVDHGLFDPSSTPERKHTGFLVLGAAMEEVGRDLIPCLFSRNLMACLIQSLQSQSEAYLGKVILKIFEGYESYATTSSTAGVHDIIVGLVRGSDYADFDTLTRTKMISSLLKIKPLQDGSLGDSLLQDLKDSSGSEVPIGKTARKRIAILNILSRAMCQAIREVASNEHVQSSSEYDVWIKTESILGSLLDTRASAVRKSGGMVEWDEASCATLQEKIALVLEACLAAGLDGQKCFLRVIAGLQQRIKLEAEETIQEVFNASWKLFEKLSPKDGTSTKDSDGKHADIHQGLRLLEALLLYDTYDGDTEAIEMLEDVTSMGGDFLSERDPHKLADQILEIIISLVSKPSRFRRRACSLVFETFAPHVSLDGLESICRILATKESRTGQQELFETGGDALSNASSAEDDGVNSEPIDSDVEIVSESEDVGDDDGDGSEQSSSSTDTDSTQNSEEGSDMDNEVADDKDDEIAKFEGALAAALGTRKINESDMADLGSEEEADTSSDSDMSDSEMIELDDKLAEVFRNQQSQNSAQKLRKEEMKNAKENVINLKNRAVDLGELFLRLQHQRGSECTKLLVALIGLAKTTGTSQLANRAIKVVGSFAQKNKGAKLPRVESDTSTREELWQHLRTLHDTAAQIDASNALIEAASQVNILLCKLLLEAGEDDIPMKMGELSKEHRAKQAGARKAHDDFWARYNDWIASVQQQAKKKAASVKKSPPSRARQDQDHRKKAKKS